MSIQFLMKYTLMKFGKMKTALLQAGGSFFKTLRKKDYRKDLIKLFCLPNP